MFAKKLDAEWFGVEHIDITDFDIAGKDSDSTDPIKFHIFVLDKVRGVVKIKKDGDWTLMKEINIDVKGGLRVAEF